MPAVTLKSHLSKGHEGFPPRPSVEGCAKVTVGGVPVHCEGHAWAAHSSGGYTHNAHLASGAPHVTIAGRGVGRVGDPISCGDTVAQGCSRVTVGNNGGPGFGREMIFKSMTDPKDKLVICLPEMAAAEAERVNARDRQGWLYLHEFTAKWLSKPAYTIRDKMDNGGQDPFWIDWDWLMQYSRFREAVAALVQREETGDGQDSWQPEYLFSALARARLAQVLAADGLLQKSGAFDHALPPWTEWRDHAFQNKAMNYSKVQAVTLANGRVVPDGLQAALANVAVYALAAGNTKVTGGKTTITVTRVSAFIHDGFEFNDEQWLGNWECSQNSKGFDSWDAAKETAGDPRLPSRLDNRHFRDFRARSGYGCDFRAICTPRLVWEGEHSYVAA